MIPFLGKLISFRERNPKGKARGKQSVARMNGADIGIKMG